MISRVSRSQHSNATHIVPSNPRHPQIFPWCVNGNTVFRKLLTSFYKNSGVPRIFLLNIYSRALLGFTIFALHQAFCDQHIFLASSAILPETSFKLLLRDIKTGDFFLVSFGAFFHDGTDSLGIIFGYQ